jgi:membrane protein implicated in regulation of membrane protease activity
MIWWYWIFLGLALAGAEMVSPGGFYLLFFGIAAVIVGALVGMNVVQADWLQWLLFSILAVLFATAAAQAADSVLRKPSITGHGQHGWRVGDSP